MGSQLSRVALTSVAASQDGRGAVVRPTSAGRGRATLSSPSDGQLVRRRVSRAALWAAGASVGVTALGHGTARGQSALEGFNSFGVSTTAPPATLTANNVSSGLDVFDPLSRGAGAPASGATNSFRTTGFQNDGISTANTDYFQFDASSTTGNALSLSSVNAFYAGTASYFGGNGVSTEFAYSLDGTNFSLISSTLTAVTTTPSASITYNLAGVAALQNVPAATTVYLRLYASGNTSTGGFGIISSSGTVNGLVVNGSVVAGAGTAQPSNVRVYDPTATGGGTSGTTFASGGATNFMDPSLGTDVQYVDGNVVNFTDLGVNSSGGAATVTVAAAGVSPASTVVNNTVGTYTFAGTGGINGTGTLTKANAGTLVLGTSNAYSGGTTITGGTVQVSSDANLGTGNVSLAGATLQTTAGFTSAKAIALGGGTDTIDTGANNLTFAGNMSGATTATLTKLGTGTLVLNPFNTSVGAVLVNAGTVTLDTTSTKTFLNAGSATIASTVNGTLNVGTTGARPVQFEPAVGSTFGGTGTINVAASSAIDEFSTGTATVTTNLTVNTDATGNSVLGGTAAGHILVLNGNVTDGAAGPGGVTFTGNAATGGLTGKTFLTGTNTYSGGTSIGSGTIVANGSSGALGTGAVVASNFNGSAGVLAGNGTVKAPVTITSGGLITAGTGNTATDTIGALTVTGTTTFNASGGYTVKVNPNATTGATDQLTLSGLTVSATATTPFVVTLQNVSTGVVVTGGSQFVLATDTRLADVNVFNSSIASGALTLATNGLSSSSGALGLAELDTATGEELVLNAGTVAAPEPTSLLLAGVAAAPLVLGRRRRRFA